MSKIRRRIDGQTTILRLRQFTINNRFQDSGLHPIAAIAVLFPVRSGIRHSVANPLISDVLTSDRATVAVVRYCLISDLLRRCASPVAEIGYALIADLLGIG